jgi:hypothetical protein
MGFLLQPDLAEGCKFGAINADEAVVDTATLLPVLKNNLGQKSESTAW